MVATIQINENLTVSVDLDNPIDISIPLHFDGKNPSCYHADPPESEIIRSGDFIGSVREGGPVNHNKITITPHGNGTHTESYGHVHESNASINQQLKKFNFLAQLLTVEPTTLDNGDSIIQSTVLSRITNDAVKAVIIRTLPNAQSKKQRNYSGSNPPYIEAELLKGLAARGVDHLLVDLPSVDKEVDGGELAGHRAFWGLDNEIRAYASITELIFIPNHVQDNLYLLQLCIPAIELDAVPSKPLLYSLR